MQNLRIFACLASCAALAGCLADRPPANGQVFAGPAELVLHDDINPKSKASGIVHHGDRLDVMQQRRRMYKVRAKSGVVGWTDERNLMSANRMEALAQLEEKVRRWPSQGVATTFEILNVHTEPQRFSPSFIRIAQGEKFDVIAHQTASRAEPARRVLVTPPPRTDANKKSAAKPKKVPPPPAPPAPKPPPNWVDLSQQRQPVLKPEPEPDSVPDQEPVPQDDWTLIRTARGAAGWVLSNRIFLAIPDEVAQYAEGHRIVTYFSLGRVHDVELDVDKEIWLWTTIKSGDHAFDFDSARVFVWNPHRHRYETAFIVKNVEGYMPVITHKADGQVTFSICLADDNGARQGHNYGMVENRVRSMGVGECVKPEAAPEPATTLTTTPAPPASFSDRLKEKAGDLRRKITGK